MIFFKSIWSVNRAFLALDLESWSACSSSSEAESEDEKSLDENEEFWSTYSSIFVKNNLTLKCLEDIAKLVNIKSGSNIPETKYLILKKFLQKCGLQIQTFILCSACDAYTKNASTNRKSVKCETCPELLSTKQHAYILYIGIEAQIKKMLEKNLGTILNFLSRSVPSEKISDIIDGTIIKNMNSTSNNDNEISLSVIMNTDGISLFKSTNKSIWPIYFGLNFLPPDIRFNIANILVISLFIGAYKPNINAFVKPIIDELQYLEKTPIEIYSQNKIHKFKIFLTHCSADMPAKAAIMNMMQYNGYDACAMCLHPGKSIPNIKSGSTVRYTFPHNVYGMRNTEEIQETMLTFVDAPNQVRINTSRCILFRSYTYPLIFTLSKNLY